MFISVDISEGLGLFILFIYIFATNSTIAMIFLILIQLEDIIFGFDVTISSVFATLNRNLFFNSGSSPFTCLINWLWHNYVSSGDQRKASALNHVCILLKLLESSPRDASSAGLSCYNTYFHCWTSVRTRINCTRLATKPLNLRELLLM